MTSTTPSKLTQHHHSRSVSDTLDSDHLDSSDGVDNDDDDVVGPGGEPVVFDDDEDDADYHFNTQTSTSRRQTVVDDDGGMDEDFVVDDEELGSGSDSPKASRFSPLQGHSGAFPHGPDCAEKGSSRSGGFLTRFGFGSNHQSRANRSHAEGSSDARRFPLRTGGRGGPGGGGGGGGTRGTGGRTDQWTERILDRNGYPGQLTFDPFLEADTPQTTNVPQHAPSEAPSQPSQEDPSTKMEPVASSSSS
ncbi:BQ2448_654 [Microbotryum intermedium]|uniref:BQ2448_654 protein n=1 Tax=Microbotryum intermedium TaxID=269621 RepID=A0A238F947_9BASI|nr:BQ2448_654 [Microbotryum intermedium]